MSSRFGWCLDGLHRIPTAIRIRQSHIGNQRRECPGEVRGQTEEQTIRCSCICHAKQVRHTTPQEGAA